MYIKKCLKYLFALTILLALALTACSSSNGDPDTTQEDNQNNDGGYINNDDPVEPEPPGIPFPEVGSTIRVAFVGGWWEDPSLFDFVFDNFREMYPQFEIYRMLPMPTSRDLLASIQAGEQPDFWLGTDTQWAQYATSAYERLMMPLNDFLERDPFVNFETLDSEIMDMFRFFNGNYYGLPYATAHQVLVWNRDMFARSGLPDRPPETWSEMLEFSQQLIRLNTDGMATQVGFSGAGTEGPFLYQILPSLRTGELDDYGLWANMTTPIIEEAHRFANEFHNMIDGIQIPGFIYSFSMGTAGMAIANLSQLSSFSEAGIDFGLAPIPRPDDDDRPPVIPSIIWQFGGIPYGAHNPEGGWLFLTHVMTEVTFSMARNDMLRSPGTALPAHAAHVPTRDRIENFFLAQANERTAEIWHERNHIFATTPLFSRRASPLAYELSNISNSWNSRRLEEGISLSDFLRGIEDEYNSVLQTWMRGMEGQGWEFPHGGTPVPPQN